MVFALPADASPENVRMRKTFDEQQAERAPANDARAAGRHPKSGGPGPRQRGRTGDLSRTSSAGARPPPRLPETHRQRKAWRARSGGRLTPSTYDGLAAPAQARGEAFEEAVPAVEAMLVSPDFLFRIRAAAAPFRGAVRGSTGMPGSVRRCSHLRHQLAARLSYFLWASTPDAKPRRPRNRLRKPGTWSRSVRM